MLEMPIGPPTTPLPVWRLVGKSIADIVANLPGFIILVGPWMAAEFAVYQWLAPMFASEMIEWILTIVLGIIAGSIVSVAWHRHVLLGEPLPRFGKFDQRCLRYAFYYGIFILWYTLIAYMPEFLMGGPALMPMMIIIVFLTCAAARYAMLFPGVAIDHRKMSFRHVWTITKGCTWRLLLGQAFLALMVFSAALLFLVISPPDLATGEPMSPWFHLGYLVAYWFAMILNAAFLSFAYMHFIEHQEQNQIR